MCQWYLDNHISLGQILVDADFKRQEAISELVQRDIEPCDARDFVDFALTDHAMSNGMIDQEEDMLTALQWQRLSLPQLAEIEA